MTDTLLLKDQDEEILDYFHNNYTLPCAIQLERAVGLLMNFGYPEVKDKLIQAFHDPEFEDPDILHVAVPNLIRTWQAETLLQHGIEITPEAMPTFLSDLLSGLLIIQDLEDPIPYLRMLETDLDDETKFCRIFKDFSIYAEETYHEYIVSILPGFMDRLYDSLSKQDLKNAIDSEDYETAAVFTEEQKKILANYRDFVAYAGKETLGYRMLDAGFKIGLDPNSYFTFVKDMLDAQEPKKMALDLLSFFFLADKTWLRPAEAYRHISEQIIHDPRMIPLVDNEIRHYLLEFEQYRKAKDATV